MTRIVRNCVTIREDADPSDALQWAKDNCPSYITCDGYLENDGKYGIEGGLARYYFIFSDESDMITFSLRWA